MFRIRTIPLAFRRVGVCVCLVGFASLQSPWAHTLKASLPCVPLPLHRTSLFPQPSQKHINRFVPHHALASLVKGRWLDGKAQALILLLSVCDTPTFFIYQTFLPSRRRDSFTPTNLSKTALSHPLFVGRASACACTASYPHYPLLRTTSLPPLSKVRCCHPKEFGRLPEGLSLHQPFSKPHYPSKIAHTLALLAPPVAPNTATFASIFLIQYTNYS